MPEKYQDRKVMRMKSCKTCKHNRPRTLKDKTCQKGHKAVFGPCKDYESKEQVTEEELKKY